MASNSPSMSVCVRSLDLEKFGFISLPASHLDSPSIRTLDIENYDINFTPYSLLKSLSVESLGLESHDYGGSLSLQASKDDADECYERFSKSLKVTIPPPEKYKGCDVEANNFLSSYYPNTTREAGYCLLSRISVESLGLESYPESLLKSLSVEYLGLESYGFISTPDSLMKSLNIKSLGLEKYGFVAEDETHEADATEKDEKCYSFFSNPDSLMKSQILSQ